jgi:hypothetical protein
MSITTAAPPAPRSRPAGGRSTRPLMITAAEARDHGAELESERALSLITELADDGPCMHDLDDQLAVCRHRYVAAGVTEIATLRAELSAANTG